MKSLIFILLLSFTINLKGQQKVVAYAPYFHNYNKSIDLGHFTHLHFFTIWPAEDGGFIWPQRKDSTYLKNKYDFFASKAKKKNVKMIITFGGTSHRGSLGYAKMAKNESSRKRFIRKALNLVKNWNADGIDIDWEWGEHEESSEDTAAYTLLLKDLRTACDKDSLLLSVDVPASQWFGNNITGSALNNADYINLMSYGYSGGWAKKSGHHAGMDKIKKIGLAYWEQKGVNPSKINIGVPYYAKKYIGANFEDSTFTDCIDMAYYKLKEYVEKGYTIVENDSTGSYCYSKEKQHIIYFDSKQNIAFKYRYAKKEGYGGVIIWEIHQEGMAQPLSNAISLEAKREE